MVPPLAACLPACLSRAAAPNALAPGWVAPAPLQVFVISSRKIQQKGYETLFQVGHAGLGGQGLALLAARQLWHA